MPGDDILFGKSTTRWLTNLPDGTKFSSGRDSLIFRTPLTSALFTMAQPRQLAWPTYIVAFSLALLPMADQLMTILPVRIGEAKWRFGAFGLLSSSLLFPCIGFMLAVYAAGAFEHRRFQRVLGFIGLALAAVVLIGVGLFALDTLQVRSAVNVGMKTGYEIASVTAAVKGLLGVLLFAGFANAALRAPKPLRAPAKEQRGGGMIIGKSPITARVTAAPKDPIAQLPE